MRFAYILIFLSALFLCTESNAQNRIAVGIKAGGILSLGQTINQVQEGTGSGTVNWSSAYGYTGGLVLIIPVQKVDYLKIGFQYDKYYNQSFSILDSNIGPNYFTEPSDYSAYRIPITYHKQFEASATSSRKRISFFLGGNFKFLNIPKVSPNNSVPDNNETLVFVNRTIDPGIIVGAGLINGFKKSGALHFELALQFHPIKNLNAVSNVAGVAAGPDEFNDHSLSLTTTYFFTKNKGKRSKGDPSRCPKL